MRRALHLVVFGVAAILPSTALASSVELRAGAFFPITGKATPSDCLTGCNLFPDLNELYGAKTSGWSGATGGVEVSHRLAPGVELGVHMDGYSRRRHTHYASSEAPRDLRQTLELSYAPIGVSLRIMPPGPRMAIKPYVAAGPDVVLWEYKEHGGYYDFDNQESFDAEYRASGATWGLHAAAGVRVPISYDFALTAEVRYLWAGKVHMGGDFVNDKDESIYDIQPGGLSATLGLRMRF
jgi:hypothetical protein